MTIHAQVQAALRWLALALGCAVLPGCASNYTVHDYVSIAQNLKERGHLRTDTNPVDAPVTLRRLERTFRDIVFQYEFHFKDGRMVNERIDKPLKRWQGHIRYKFIGDAVTAQDRRDVTDLTAEISRLTGLTFREVTGQYDLLISIATPKGRNEVSRILRKSNMPTYRQRYETWRKTPGWVCGATLSTEWDAPGRLSLAHVFMGSEVTGLLRKACLHEEIVQALGLTNDSPAARPSIFNDDQEFALMTEHDGMLLRALYDPRLRPGMTAEEAMPTVREVLGEVLADHGQTTFARAGSSPNPG